MKMEHSNSTRQHERWWRTRWFVEQIKCDQKQLREYNCHSKCKLIITSAQLSTTAHVIQIPATVYDTTKLAIGKLAKSYIDPGPRSPKKESKVKVPMAENAMRTINGSIFGRSDSWTDSCGGLSVGRNGQLVSGTMVGGKRRLVGQ